MINYRLFFIWRKGLSFIKKFRTARKHLSLQKKGTIVFQIKKTAVSLNNYIPHKELYYSNMDWKGFLQDALESSFEIQAYLTITTNFDFNMNEQLIMLEQLVKQQIVAMNTFLKPNTLSNHYLIPGTI